MASSSVDPPPWGWPEDLPGAWKHEDSNLSETRQRQPFQQDQQEHQDTQSRPQQPPPPTNTSDSAGHHQRERHYPPRTCRICLESVLPTYNPPSESLPSFMRSSPSVTYESDDGGRLLRPCLCKGSQKYVHENCLQAWRLQDPMAKRNYWQCPTCRYRYHLERMTWAHWISSTGEPATLVLPTPNLLILQSFSNRTYHSHLPRRLIHSRLLCRPHHQPLH